MKGVGTKAWRQRPLAARPSTPHSAGCLQGRALAIDVAYTFRAWRRRLLRRQAGAAGGRRDLSPPPSPTLPPAEGPSPPPPAGGPIQTLPAVTRPPAERARVSLPA